MFKSYYSVGEDTFYNKNQAILKAGGDLSRIKLHFDEKVWDTIDWSIEPSESWQELCAQRALELRAKYDYLALWYSGGYDSHTILLTFIKNKIPLDELLIFDRSNVFYDSGNLHAINTAKLVKENYYPDIKINVVEYDFNDTTKLYKQWGDDWIFKNIGSTTRFSKTNRKYLINDYDTIQLKIKKTHRRCDIFGHDKCKVYCYDNKWYAFFTDSNLADFCSDNQEDFYYSPQLYKKQVYNTISWFESLPDFNPELVHEVQGRDRRLDGNYVKYYKDWNLAMGRYPLNPLDTDSINGIQKFLYTEETDSPDCIKILTYYKNYDKQIYNIYINGFNELKRLLGQYNLSINPTILSKPYFVRQARIGSHPK